MRLKFLVPVEVGMDTKMATATGHVDAAAHQVRVGQQVVDTREFFQETHERTRVEFVDGVAQRRGKVFLVGASELDLESVRAKSIPGDVAFVGSGKNACQFKRAIGSQEVIDNQMRVWIGTGELLATILGNPHQPVGFVDVRHRMSVDE